MDPCAEFESLNSDSASSTMLIMVSDSSGIKVWDRVGKVTGKLLHILFAGPRSRALWSPVVPVGTTLGVLQRQPLPIITGEIISSFSIKYKASYKFFLHHLY